MHPHIRSCTYVVQIWSRVYYNDGCEKCTLLPLLYRPACPSDSLRLANQEQVRGSCISFESLGAVGSSSCTLCVYFESLGAVGSSSTRIVCFLREALIRHLRGGSTSLCSTSITLPLFLLQFVMHRQNQLTHTERHWFVIWGQWFLLKSATW